MFNILRTMNKYKKKKKKKKKSTASLADEGNYEYCQSRGAHNIKYI